MKKLLYYITLVSLLVLGACTTNPLDDIEEGTWNKERNVTLLLVEGQIGLANIERDANNAIITVFCRVDEIADLSQVEIKDIQLAYGASSVNVEGTTLDFSNGNTPTITVKSANGATLQWMVKMNPFKSDLEGVWYYSDMAIFCDFFSYETWGWTETAKLIDLLPSAKPELDNVITFTIEGADADGNPFGSYKNDVGPNGEYGTYIGTGFTEVEGELDLTDRFRKMPKGEGTWVRDYAQNKVIITDEYNQEFVLDLILNEETGDVTLSTSLPYLTHDYNWTSTDYTYEKLTNVSNRYWYDMVREAPEIPVSSEAYINSFSVEGQVSPAVIDNDNLTVRVTLNGEASSLAAVTVDAVTLAAYATADVEVGSTFDLSNGNTATFTVTAEDGTTQKIYTLSAVDTSSLPKFDISGEWNIKDIMMFVDYFSWETWGSVETLSVANYFPAISAEMDNKLTLTVTSADTGSGVESGTYSFSSGADATYTDFTYTSTLAYVNSPVDLNSRLRIMPTTDGTWVFTKNADYTGGEMVITVNGIEHRLTVELNDDNTFNLKATLVYDSGSYYWNGEPDYNYEKLAHLSKEMWYTFTKEGVTPPVDPEPEEFTVDGNWSVSDVQQYVNYFSWYDWGSEEYKSMSEYFSAISEDMDNKLFITTTTPDDGSGVESGDYNFTAGADGLYTDFTYNSTSTKLPDPIDLNSRLRIMPKGKGAWVYTKNAERTGGVMVITMDADATQYTLTVEEKEDGSMVLKADLEDLNGQYDWDNSTVDYTYEKLAHVNRAMWYIFVK